jgi:hypothetical protein
MYYEEENLYFEDVEMPERDTSHIDIHGISQEVRARIAELRSSDSFWAPEVVFDQMRIEGFSVSLDEIYACWGS